MVVENVIKTKISYPFKTVSTVFEKGSSVLTSSPVLYISSSTLKNPEDFLYPTLALNPTIGDTLEIWGSVTIDLYPPKQKFTERDFVKIEESRSVTTEADFYRLAQQWEVERPYGGDVLEMVMQTSYQRIIGIGPDAVPLLLKELERKPDHWFWALYSITGVDPVLPEHQGNLQEMAKDWIDWGKRVGYNW